MSFLSVYRFKVAEYEIILQALRSILSNAVIMRFTKALKNILRNFYAIFKKVLIANTRHNLLNYILRNYISSFIIK